MKQRKKKTRVDLKRVLFPGEDLDQLRARYRKEELFWKIYKGVVFLFAGMGLILWFTISVIPLPDLTRAWLYTIRVPLLLITLELLLLLTTGLGFYEMKTIPVRLRRYFKAPFTKKQVMKRLVLSIILFLAFGWYCVTLTYEAVADLVDGPQTAVVSLIYSYHYWTRYTSYWVVHLNVISSTPSADSSAPREIRLKVRTDEPVKLLREARAVPIRYLAHSEEFVDAAKIQ